LVAAIVGARGYGDGPAGAAFGGFAVAYACVGGFLAIGGDQALGELGAPHLLIGASAGLLTSVVAAIGIGTALRVFVATGTLAVAGIAAAIVAFSASTAGAAAVILSAAVLLVPVVPTISLRLGRVPLPVVTRRAAGGLTAEPVELPPLPDRDSVFAIVARTDEMLTGLVTGAALAAVGAGAVLVTSGSTAGRILTAIAAGVLAVRARSFVAVAQRLPLLLAGLVGVAVAAGAGLGSFPPSIRLLVGLPIAVLAAMATAGAGAVYRRRPPSPYLSRFTDILDGLLVISVVPVTCAVLGLFGWARDLAG
jgi:type VII secretion integral membrane protein EccD